MRPETEAELAEIIASCTQPLEIVGGGSRRGFGNSVQGDALHTSGLSGVTLYDPAALTLVAKAGTPLAEIDATLKAEGQMLPFEPIDHRHIYGHANTATLGGMVAVNASGPRRIKAGACRDSLLGVRFVDGMGQVVKNGGRVMKNVTGYDIVKLMAGSHGTLGVLTEVAFRVLPIPPFTITLRFELALDSGLAKLRAAMTTPYDVSAAAYVGGAAYIRLEGLESSVKYRAAQMGGEPVEFDWQMVRDVKDMQDAETIWRLSVVPSQAFEIAEKLHDLGFQTPVFDWSGGLIWVTGGDGSDAPRKLARGQGVCLKGNHKAFAPQPEPLARISAGLRQKFDPIGILNQGRMG